MLGTPRQTRATPIGPVVVSAAVSLIASRRLATSASRRPRWRRHRAELDTATEATPAAPSPAAIRRLRDNLAAVLTNGTPGQRKAIIETHVAEIRIEDDHLNPIFKIPLGDEEGPAREADPTFRTTHRVVGPTMQNARTIILRPGDPLPTHPARTARSDRVDEM
jgi:hypothetical protein